MNHRNCRPAVFAAALFLAALSQADDEPQGPRAAVGSRVRVTAASPAFTGSVVGTLVKLGPETLMIVDPSRGLVSELPLDSVRRFEVSRRGSRARRGLFIGAAIGVLAAVAISSDETITCNGYNEPARLCDNSEKALYGAFAVGVYGGIGAWIGNRRKTDTWSEAPLGSLRVGLRPVRGGARAGLTFTF